MLALHRFRLLVLPGVLAVLLAGCESDPMKAPPGGRVDLLPLEDYPQIVVTSNLQKWLAFSPATVVPSSEKQPMSVQVPVRSLYDKGQLRIQYRFEFLDEKGLPVGPPPGYRFAVLEPRLLVYLEGNAMETSAVDWRLVVRPAR